MKNIFRKQILSKINLINVSNLRFWKNVFFLLFQNYHFNNYKFDYKHLLIDFRYQLMF
jgi:hypothetical protein